MPDESKLRFRRARRLTQPGEFARVKKEGAVQRGTFMLLSVLSLTTSESSAFRAGFITTKRLGNAVTRNRIRRRLREIVRRHQVEMRADIWLVIIAKTTAVCASYRELEDEYLRLARRASILAPSWFQSSDS